MGTRGRWIREEVGGGALNMAVTCGSSQATRIRSEKPPDDDTLATWFVRTSGTKRSRGQASLKRTVVNIFIREIM